MTEYGKLQINEVLGELCLEENLQEEQNLRDDLGLDSLSLVELLVKLEDLFDAELEMSDLDPANLNTVSDLYQLMEKYAEDDADAV